MVYKIFNVSSVLSTTVCTVCFIKFDKVSNQFFDKARNQFFLLFIPFFRDFIFFRWISYIYLSPYPLLLFSVSRSVLYSNLLAKNSIFCVNKWN